RSSHSTAGGGVPARGTRPSSAGKWGGKQKPFSGGKETGVAMSGKARIAIVGYGNIGRAAVDAEIGRASCREGEEGRGEGGWGRRRHTSFSRDWSSDVCSSDLGQAIRRPGAGCLPAGRARHRQGNGAASKNPFRVERRRESP